MAADAGIASLRQAAADALIGGLVAAALALPMLGFRLVDSALALSLGLRLDWVLWAALAVAAGRFGLNLLRLGGTLPRLSLPDALTARLGGARPWFGWALIGFAVMLPFLPFADRNLVDKATLVLIYVMLGWGLNIVVGLAGLLDLGFVAFYAVGAYSYALLATKLGWSFWVCLPLAGMLAASFGVTLGFPVLRLRGDYLAIVTLGFGEIIRVVLQNWQDFTNGPAGITGIPRPTLFGLPFAASAPAGGQTFAEFFGLEFSGNHRIIFLYFVILVLALLTNLFTLRIRRLPIGRAWEALREDEIACRSLGLNPTNIKLSAFATGAMFAGFAGSFFATRQGFISPESFTFIESAVILAIVVLGGMGSQVGVVLAALLLVGLPEWFRELQQYRMLAFGGAMVLIMLWKPSGLLSSRSPTISLGEAEMTFQPLLEVEHVTMRFGGLFAVNDLSFVAARRAITAVIGPNGAGKTTLFNCITGFYKPQVGRLALRHDSETVLLERLDDHRIASKARVARTFQNIRLFPRMSVLENLIVAQHNVLMRASVFSLAGLLGLGRYRHAEAQAVERARYWLDKVGLLKLADEEAGALPYGSQRRLEIARAMCTDPVLLCLDEPAAGLNPRESAELNTLLTGIRDEHGIGLLLIEHDMSVVMGISDWVVVLDYGRKIAEGRPADVRRDPAVIRAYLGEEEDEALPPEVAGDVEGKL